MNHRVMVSQLPDSLLGKRRRDDSDSETPSKHQRGTAATPSAPQPPVTSKTYRVRRIARQYKDKEILGGALSHLLRLDDSNPVHVISLTTCPINSQELIATVSFAEEPDALSIAKSHRQRGTEWRFKAPAITRDDIIFDSDFMGFTPFHHQDDTNCTIDIVALSGLNGHPFGSFKERDGSFMWIRDGLPKDLPQARIFTYGYDTSILKSESFQTIGDLGVAFLEALCTIRCVAPYSNPERPLIIIGHSLGGLVAKEAIVQTGGSTAKETYKNISRSIVGLLLFGVPCQGMAVESLLPMVWESPNEAFLRTLGKNSQVLQSQRDDFQAVFNSEETKVYSFYETLRSPTAVKIGGKWSMNGPPVVLVEKDSAIHGRFPQEKCPPFIYPINQNHSEMVKFTGRSDLVYQAVLDRLRKLHQGAEDVVQTRYKVFASNPSLGTSRSLQQQACLESLAFPEQLQRQDEVLTAKLNGTCNWLLSHTEYARWLPQPTGLLWVQGNPGAGKSTVMKFIVDDIRGRSRRSVEAVASFFFHGRGTSIQRTTVGLYRSLLNQLLARLPHQLDELTEIFEEKCDKLGRPGKDWNWLEGELCSFIAAALPRASRKTPITICVDALDECGRQAATGLVSYAKQLIAQAKNIGGRLRICFACRYYPALNLDCSFTIRVEKENSSDIRNIVASCLADFPETGKDDVVEEISQRADGVFQWAVLVASQMMELRSKGAPLRVIKRRMQEIPTELHQLYATLLEDTTEDDRACTLRLLQWICYAQYPLNATQLRHALAIDARMPHRSIIEYQDGDLFADDTHQLKAMVNHLSKGLVQIINNRAQFIHQSVFDYLLRCGLQNLGSTTRGSAKGCAHFEISRACIRYLQLREIAEYPYPEEPREQLPEQGFRAERALDSAFPLARYAIFSLPWHLTQVEEEGIPQTDLPELFSWPFDEEVLRTWGTLADVTDFLNNGWRFDWPVEGSRLVHLLAEYDIRSAFDCILHSSQVQEDSRLLDPEDGYHRTPLYFALIKDRNQIVQQLLAVDAVEKEFLGPYHSSVTPLQIAVERRQVPLIQQLITAGIYSDYGQSAMDVAIDRDDLEVIHILLEATAGQSGYSNPKGTVVHYAVRTKNLDLLQDALEAGWDVNALGKFGRTPIFDAVVAECRNMDIVRELLGARADPNIADEEGETPLHYAVDHDLKSLLVLLLEAVHTKPSLTQSGANVVTRAAERGNRPIVKLLLERGFISDLLSEADNKALKRAADLGHKSSVLPILHTANASPNRVFMVAISIRYFAFASHLLDSGTIDPAPTDANQEVPLHCAARSGEEILIQRLLQDTRTDINRKSLPEGNTALLLAVQSMSTEAVQCLLARGLQVNPDIPNAVGQTPLLWAARNGSLPIVKMLIATGRVTVAPAPDKYDVTPLSAAVSGGWSDLVQLFLEFEELKNNQEEIQRAIKQAMARTDTINPERQKIKQMLGIESLAKQLILNQSEPSPPGQHKAPLEALSYSGTSSVYVRRHRK